MSHLIALAALAAAPPPAPGQLAAALGGPSFRGREAATKALWARGEAARPALEAAVRSGDPEAARRAAGLLERFDWGLYADTPAAVRDEVRRFRSGDPADQHAALTALARAGATDTLRAVLARPHPPPERPRLFAHYTEVARRLVPPLLLAGEHDRAGRLLALHALGADTDGLLDLSVFEHLRNKPEPVPAVPPGASARLELFRRRAANDLPSALEAAGRTPGADAGRLRDALLEDAGDWATLAGRPVREANSEAGLRAFRLRLAGRPGDAARLLDEQPDAPLGPPRLSAQQLDEPTLALVLNGRADAAAARLARLGYAPHVLADWLVAQLRFKEALALIEREGKRGPDFDERFYAALYGTRRGRLLAMLGDRAGAEAAFRDTYRAAAGQEAYPLEQLVRAEVRAGRADLACEHLGAAVDDDRQHGRGFDGSRELAFEALFEGDADVGAALMRLLAPRGPSGPGLRRAKALLAGKGDPADVRAVAAARPPDPGPEPDRAMVHAQAVAAVLRAAGRADEAVAVLAGVADKLPPEADGPAAGRPRGPKGWVYDTDERARFWLEFGDTLTGLGRHAEAADRLYEGWGRFPDNPTLLFLSGRALAKAGRAADGKARQAAAHWVALGNARPRGRFLEELNARGLGAAAGRELDLADRAGWAGGHQVANVWNQAARAAAAASDFRTAARLLRRAVHWVLKAPGTYYVEGAAYLTVPQQLAAAEARGLLADGQVAEAFAAADACLATLPANTDAAVALVAAFDAAGHPAEADKLFRRPWDALRRVVADHPDGAWARAEAALLAASCRREPAAAAELAEWAAARDPNAVSVRKALAEVRFRRGDRAGAVAVMTALAADDRLSHTFRRQVERYRTAPADAPPLDAEDE